MAYTDVEFTNGQIVNETDMDTVQGNIDHVRSDTEVRVLATNIGELSEFYPGLSQVNAACRVDIVIGATTYSSDAITSTTFVDLTGLRDESLTGLTDSTLYTGTIKFMVKSVFTWWQAGTFPFPFYHTPDIDYISVFGNIRRAQVLEGGGQYSLYCITRGLTIVGHRLTKAW